ncbi:sodium:solute symporter family transporter [Spirillospora albida]|uniref:sodium:solute symporter family transporter n=1 Tax=Spirillospora albida TaxID=58123 RepID=UPI00055B6FE7|nr:hypothetical protein [Spirillospora albida]
MTVPAVAAALTVLVVVPAVTALLGAHARNRARTTSDLLAASRGVGPVRNATAIGGECVCAAVFLGTAGLVLVHGADMLWLPLAATAGHVLLLALVTAPLRRSGAYTLSDFAEWRLGSCAVRRIVTGCVCFVGWFSLLPQFHGAGVTLRVLTGAPEEAGWAVVVGAALALAGAGGLRGARFWLKLVAVAVPAVALLAMWRLDGAPDPAADRLPHFPRDTVVRVSAPAALTVPADVAVTVRGRVDGVRHDGGGLTLSSGRHTVGKGTELAFPAGAVVPHAERLPVKDGATWATPFGGAHSHALYGTFSALLGVLLGTMGLPHILTRFYTNTSGAAARRTAAYIPAFLALFSLFPAVHGMLGRLYTPELLVTGDMDATVLLLPQRMLPGAPGALLTGLVAAGAFAAFISTACAIVVAIAGTLSQRMRRGGGVTAFRLCAVLALAAPLTVVPRIGAEGAALLLTTALTVSACSLCPLLVLGIWWRGLTAAGAAAGLLAGGGLAVAAGIVRLLGGAGTGWPAAIIGQPALLAVPLAFATMVAVSRGTRPPQAAERALARLHLPEKHA